MLAMLMLVFAIQYLDRQIVVVLAEPIKKEFALSDAQLGLLTGFVFSIPYSLMLLPVGMMVDRFNRRNMLAAALMIWSLMTLLTGLVRNLTQLVVARAIIAGAEATNNPAALSLLADLFGKRNRATAIGIFYAGPAIATVLGFAAIGAISEQWGWRAAFFAAGIPGILLGVLFMATASEPAREKAGSTGAGPAPPLRQTVRFLLTQRSIRHLLMAMTLTSIVNSGQIAWLSSLLIRVHGMSLVGAATTISIAYGIVLTIGQIFGGVVVDRLAARDIAWIGLATGICAVTAGMAMIAATLSTSLFLTIALLACWALPTGCQYGPVMGTLQGLVAPRMRGVTNAIMSVLINLLGAGLGPLIAGSLSDAFASFSGGRSIGFAMATLALLQFWAAAHFLCSRRSLRGDMARADAATIAAPAGPSG